MAMELKITVRPEQTERAASVFGLDKKSARKRDVYFYDTPDLKLFNAGIVLRARKEKGAADDATVKIRPMAAEDAPEHLMGEEGFKTETDVVGNREVPSASYTAPTGKGEIDDVASGKRGVNKLYSKEQEEFLQAYGKIPVDFDKLDVMGPIETETWKTRKAGFDGEITIERWHIPDGREILELSAKVKPDAFQAMRGDFTDYLTSQGIDPNGGGETKTKAALEALANP